MNKLFTIFAMALVAGIMLWSGDALATVPTSAENQGAWTLAINKVTEAFQYSRKLIFIIGGFGLITLAFFAIFGKIRWSWFAALCVGLGIVAIAGYIINYVTESDSGSRQVRVGASGDVGTTYGGSNYGTFQTSTGTGIGTS